LGCHPEAPFFGAEGPVQPAGSAAAAGESIGPSARKKRGPQDDNAKQTAPLKDVDVFRAFVNAG